MISDDVTCPIDLWRTFAGVHGDRRVPWINYPYPMHACPQIRRCFRIDVPCAVGGRKNLNHEIRYEGKESGTAPRHLSPDERQIGRQDSIRVLIDDEPGISTPGNEFGMRSDVSPYIPTERYVYTSVRITGRRHRY